ncbi:MAG: 4-hydroxythreonine-4-phosphate dehydrogenase PdxA [Hyphomicrobiaceae bacterium]
MSRALLAGKATAAASPLAATMGDPAGIGLDIVLAALSGPFQTTLPRFVLYACPEALGARCHRLGLTVDIAPITRPNDALALSPTTLAVIPLSSVPSVTPGRPDAAYGPAVIAAIEHAVAAVVRGEASGLVTNPIAKHVLYASGFRHPGHTEFLAELAGRHLPGRHYTPVMMLASDELRVVPLTIHVPLADVPRLITRDVILATARITAAALVHDFGLAKPRIAVAGLNPHAGESGSIGREDIDIIAPALAELRAEGLDIVGPLAADTLFHAEARARYDAAIAMYHDQALIPIKTLAFDRGVNVTLGLPFVRTSPDHGTAFDIAGTGRANPRSFIEALRLADHMVAARAARLATA